MQMREIMTLVEITENEQMHSGREDGWMTLAGNIASSQIDGPFTVTYYSINTPAGVRRERIFRDSWEDPMKARERARKKNALTDDIRVSHYEQHDHPGGVSFTEVARFESVKGRGGGMRSVPPDQAKITPDQRPL